MPRQKVPREAAAPDVIAPCRCPRAWRCSLEPMEERRGKERKPAPRETLLPEKRRSFPLSPPLSVHPKRPQVYKCAHRGAISYCPTIRSVARSRRDVECKGGGRLLPIEAHAQDSKRELRRRIPTPSRT